ncbi:U4/U6 small nuclear ribonucleo protein PRP4 [Aspergillus ellipticus CBS 707.79]|uniref:non-specific serine/threonine protein kinase n=1 Tax=Aspergillus ellipticus CBS 707.79 TaxID=1448320 RepID=A0A319CZ08_9EURO|nr:U4/U6 small nuclear ribonucleo protein PRP4 [Aspergillus ellipticus CBS 707.79]
MGRSTHALRLQALASRCPLSRSLPYPFSSHLFPYLILRYTITTTTTPCRPITSPPQWTSPLREFPTTGLPLLDPSVDIEEETLPTYEREEYYPAQQGEVLHRRYQILAKLGYGVTSTVWLCRDLCDSKYVAIKIYINGQKQNRELDIYNHITSVEADHPGKDFIRKLLDHFSIKGPHGDHVCLVHEPLGISANQLLRNYIPGRTMTLEEMKPCIRQLLIAVDFLHSVAGIVHTDLQPKNLLLPTTDKTLYEFEEREIEAPSPRKALTDRTIYKTSVHFPGGDGLPLLCDFGEARFGNVEHTQDIMPVQYRAPEVVMRSKWDYKVDVWSVVMVAWDIVAPRNLFNGKNPDRIFDDRVHVAEMVALLGPPPAAFRERSKLASVFWDEHGNWKDLAPIPDISLESRAADITGKDKEGFLRWLRAALQWNAEDRPSAVELLFDEWLMEGLHKKEDPVNLEA